MASKKRSLSQGAMPHVIEALASIKSVPPSQGGDLALAETQTSEDGAKRMRLKQRRSIAEKRNSLLAARTGGEAEEGGSSKRRRRKAKSNASSTNEEPRTHKRRRRHRHKEVEADPEKRLVRCLEGYVTTEDLPEAQNEKARLLNMLRNRTKSIGVLSGAGSYALASALKSVRESDTSTSGAGASSDHIDEQIKLEVAAFLDELNLLGVEPSSSRSDGSASLSSSMPSRRVGTNSMSPEELSKLHERVFSNRRRSGSLSRCSPAQHSLLLALRKSRKGAEGLSLPKLDITAPTDSPSDTPAESLVVPNVDPSEPISPGSSRSSQPADVELLQLLVDLRMDQEADHELALESAAQKELEHALRELLTEGMYQRFGTDAGHVRTPSSASAGTADPVPLSPGAPMTPLPPVEEGEEDFFDETLTSNDQAPTTEDLSSPRSRPRANSQYSAMADDMDSTLDDYDNLVAEEVETVLRRMEVSRLRKSYVRVISESMLKFDGLHVPVPPSLQPFSPSGAGVGTPSGAGSMLDSHKGEAGPASDAAAATANDKQAERVASKIEPKEGWLQKKCASVGRRKWEARWVAVGLHSLDGADRSMTGVPSLVYKHTKKDKKWKRVIPLRGCALSVGLSRNMITLTLKPIDGVPCTLGTASIEEGREWHTALSLSIAWADSSIGAVLAANHAASVAVAMRSSQDRPS